MMNGFMSSFRMIYYLLSLYHYKVTDTQAAHTHTHTFKHSKSSQALDIKDRRKDLLGY